ncbi:aminotransferase class I/II-fold pyridoxal phosphate-dependent enzyme [Pseudonocardia sp. MCCB 268]|nr:aminotransferase class I/II-fold pyridoxal phosphate-dependent enzyme [Pseudonocardia cytotoxica]
MRVVRRRRPGRGPGPAPGGRLSLIDVAAVEAAVTPRTKVILIGSPANPTGAGATAGGAARARRAGRSARLHPLSDEIYDRLTYQGTHTCLGAVPAPASGRWCSAGSPGAVAMTGWRVGWLAALPPDR